MTEALGAWPWSPAWQGLLDGLGWVLARIYDVVPNYGVTIIVLTFVIRVVLLPLGIKQVKSMQSMQAIQPKVKAVQQKYKGNKQRQQEEVMKLYKEHGVNPFSGCWPVLLQFPILIAMYAVLRPPTFGAEGEVRDVHLPQDSRLYRNVVTHQGTDFVWMNLQCAAAQAGQQVRLTDAEGEPTDQILNCGQGLWVRSPYYLFVVAMIATTYYQQRQMQRASPPGAQSAQQQAIMRVMPLMFGIFGFTFPSGLVVYWTTSNVWQIGQQYFMLKAGHIGPQAPGGDGGRASSARRGFLASLIGRTEGEQGRHRRETAQDKRPKGNPKKGSRERDRKKRPKR